MRVSRCRWVLAASLLVTFAASADVTINEIRTFSTNANTTFLLDGERLSASEAEAKGLGMVAKVDVADDVSADFTSGTALAVALDNQLKGPVTALNPLTVLRQPVVVTGDTVLADIPGNDLANLGVGDIVEVSGFADADNSVRATRIEAKLAGTPVWKLTGVAADVSATGFNVGAQAVLFGGVTPRDCDGGLTAGTPVEVKAAADAGFAAGDPLTTVTDIECQRPGLAAPAGQAVPAEVEGLVTELISAGEFIVNGQRVRTTAATVYRGGDADDVILGARLEAEGVFNADTAVLTANKISFRETRVRIEAPATPADVVAGESVTLLGITVRFTAQTRDEDGILSGLAENQQVEVRGFRDRLGQVFATRVRERGDPDANDGRLRGPVASIDAPRLVILGVTLDTTNSVLPDQFFNRIRVGTQVQIEDARYDSGSNTISGGRVEIEDDTVSRIATATRSRAVGVPAVAGTGIGTVTQITVGGAGAIFSNGFERAD